MLFPERYLEDVTRQYDACMEILNDPNQPDLTMDVFAEFGIHTLKDLGWYLERNAEYGGCVTVPWSDQRILIPFHNDFMNAWLRFDNPRVIEFYDQLYESRKANYFSRDHFDKERFHIEEDMQLNNWIMPPVDRRMLSAPINGCWDRPELIARFLELQGYETRRLSCHDDYVMRGHCFTIYTDGEYWYTTSSLPVNTKSRDYEEFCNRIFRVLRHLPIYSDHSRCRLVEFEAPRAGMTTREYLGNIERGTVVAR